MRYRLEYGLYLAVRTLLRCVPHRWVRRCGRVFGSLVHRLSGRDRRRAVDNLARVLPELPLDERAELARQSFRSLGAAVFDTLSVHRFDAEQLAGRVEVRGWEHVEAALAGGHGAFLLSAHLGAWEVPAYAAALRGKQIALVSNTLQNPRFDRELRRLRARLGVGIIDKRGASRKMYRQLISGGLVGIAMDQRVPEDDAIHTEFLGQTSLISPLPAYLCLWTGAAGVPTFAVPDGDGYTVTFEAPISPPMDAELGPRQEPQAIAAFTRQLVEPVERRILKHPEAWIWLYRRWKPTDSEPRAARSSLASM